MIFYLDEGWMKFILFEILYKYYRPHYNEFI